MKQKIVELKFVNWTSKIVELRIANEPIFITFTYLIKDFNLLGHKIT